MSTVPQNELLEYLKTVIAIETDLATQEQMITQCCAEIHQREPVLKLEDIPAAPQYEVGEANYGLGALCVGAGFVFFLILLQANIGVALLFGSIGVIPGILMIKAAKNREDRNGAIQHAHNERVARVHEENLRREKAHKAALRDCSESDRAIREAAQPYIADTRRLLDKLYEKGLVYRKYCTLPALTSIYEYFVTGRCTELSGPHGAYNLYEDEVRKDTVISQLNTVIENLEQIKQNQYMLYQQVKTIQENTAQIISELRQIRGYTVQIAQLTALNTYYAALNERNTRITMYYHL